ncbi:MAG: BMP family protein, partial [Promethearchaeota archaeon]
MRRRILIAVLLVATFTILPFCHPVVETKAEMTNVKQAIDVACVFATGGLGDKSFNDMAKAGLDRAISEGLMNPWGSGSQYSEPDEIAEYAGLIENYATAGTYDLIVTIGFDQSTAVNTTALAHPEQPIVLIDMVIVQGAVRSVVFNAGQGSFLVGAMAGLMTEKNKVGFVGGMDIPLIREFWAGYKAGVLYENDEVEVFENFVGDWDDPVTGKSQAEALWAQGVDIIFSAAGKSGLGVLESVEDKEVGKYWVIGVDSDQDWLYPGQVLCSMMKRVDLGVYHAVADVYNDEWIASADPFAMDIVAMQMTNDPDTNGVGISPLTYTKDEIGTANIAEVNETVRGKILDGSIRIPVNESDLEDWLDEMDIDTSKGDGIPGFEWLFTLGGLAVIPVIISAIIAPGSSVRGLSLVTK